MVASISDWLEEIGLGKYADAFAENAITFDVLPMLTEDHLRELRVTAIGDRLRLMAAIKVLTPVSEKGIASSVQDAPPTATGKAERRQITVLFCDLVGSTQLAERLDPEDLRDVMRHYQDAVATAAMRHGGHVAKYLGDGALVCFGWPQAYEDQAVRALRAGLEAVAAVRAIAVNNDHLDSRVGIATGEVVVGELVGSASHDAEAISGETPNLAARLQSEAEPSQVVIGETTKKLVARFFELEDIGNRSLKGFSEPISAWRVVAERDDTSRFATAAGQRATALRGRDKELAQLQESWRQVQSGAGQAVLLSGEAGIGKSRLLLSLREVITGAPHIPMRYQCSPYHTKDAFYPIIQQLQHAAGIGRQDLDEEKLGRLQQLLSQTGDSGRAVVPLFASLLSIPAEARYAPLALSPQQLKDRIIGALIDQLCELSRSQPVLMVFEDVHWIDPTTLELLERAVVDIEGASVLMVITHRPEWQPTWPAYAHSSVMALSRLSRQAVEAMVRELTPTNLDADLVDHIARRTDGIPLFVEELTKTVLEREGKATDAIPDTLQASLLSRLDRLGSAKELAQAAAVIGREFSYELLEASVDQERSSLNHTLAQLVESELVFQRGAPPHASYVFKHALVQDAAYDSLLRERKRDLHARIGSALEAQQGDDDAVAALLARHFRNAGDIEKAIHYYTAAGRRARLQFANDEAASHFSMALELLEESETLDPDFRRRLQLVDQSASLLLMMGEYLQAHEICANIIDRSTDAPGPMRMPLLIRLGRALYMQGKTDEALTSYNQALEIAQTLQDRRRMAALVRDIGDVQFTAHGLPIAIESYARALRISEELDDPAGIAAALTMLSNAHCRAGDFDIAIECAERAIAIGEDLGDRRRLAWARIMLMQCCRHDGLWREEIVEQYLGETQELMTKIGDYRGETWCMVWRSDLHEGRDDLSESISLSKAIIGRAMASGGFQHEMASALARLARRQLLIDQDEAAMASCQQAITVSEQNSNIMEHGRALVMLALLYARPKHLNLAKAEQAFQDALVQIDKAGTKHVRGIAMLAGAEIAMVSSNLALAHKRADEAKEIFERHRCVGLLQWHQSFAKRLSAAGLTQ